MLKVDRSGVLSFGGAASPFYDILPDYLQSAVDKAAAALLQSLRDQEVAIPVSGHMIKVVDEVGRWLVETGVVPVLRSTAKAGAPDAEQVFMMWWKTSCGADPVRVLRDSSDDEPL